MPGLSSTNLDNPKYVAILRRIYGALDYHNDRTPEECLPAHIRFPEGVTYDECIDLLDKMKEDGLVVRHLPPNNDVHCDMLDAFDDGYGYKPDGAFFKERAVWVAPGFREKTFPLLYPKKYKPGYTEKVLLMKSTLFGLHFPGTPQVNYWPRGAKRGAMLELLCDGTGHTAEELALRVKSKPKQIYGEIDTINANFKSNLGSSLPNLIVHSDKAGFFIDTSRYELRDAEY